MKIVQIKLSITATSSRTQSQSDCRDGIRLLTAKEKHPSFDGCFLFGCSNNLSSRTVSSQVLSALMSLTSVFGMRTGGSSPPLSPQWYIFALFAYIFCFFNSVESQLHRKYQTFLSLSSKSYFFFSFFSLGQIF